MSASLLWVLGSGSFSLFLVILFSIENGRGSRFGESFRGIIDRMFLGMGRSMRARFPVLNRAFFRELFHYVLHLILAFTLFVLRRLESITLSVVRHNRVRARALRAEAERKPDPHLQAIADHKKSITLSDKEKNKRKADALRGDH